MFRTRDTESFISWVDVLAADLLALKNSTKKWIPKENEIYYYYDFINNVIQQNVFSKTFRLANRYLKLGNCFKTRNEITDEALFKVLKKMKKFYKKNGFGLEK